MPPKKKNWLKAAAAATRSEASEIYDKAALDALKAELKELKARNKVLERGEPEKEEIKAENLRLRERLDAESLKTATLSISNTSLQTLNQTLLSEKAVLEASSKIAVEKASVLQQLVASQAITISELEGFYIRYTEDGTINPKTRIWELEDKVTELENALTNSHVAQTKFGVVTEEKWERERMEWEVEVEKLEGEVFARDKALNDIRECLGKWQDRVKQLRKSF